MSVTTKLAASGKTKTNNAVSTETETEKRWKITATVLMISYPLILFLSIFLFAAQAAKSSDRLTIWGTFLMLAAAATCLSGLVGFLFGIPRTLQRTKEESEQLKEKDEDQPAVKYGANTNLEQISDWLTKILVGVGLTQIAAIKPALRDFAIAISGQIKGVNSVSTFSISLLLYTVACGFLLGYIWTRLHFIRELSHADVEVEMSRMKDKVSELEAQTQADARALLLVQNQIDPGRDTVAPTEEQLTEALQKASDSVRRQAYNQAHENRKENWANNERKPRMERSIMVFRALINTDADAVYHNYHAQLGYALKDKLPPDLPGAIEELTKAINMRGTSESAGWESYEFNRALCRIQLDPILRGGPPTEASVKQAILADLTVAAGAPYLQGWFDREKEIAAWLKAHKLELPSITFEETTTT